MKEILYGTNDKEPHTETVAQLAQELYNSGLLISLVENLQVIDFEVSHSMFRCVHRYQFILIINSFLLTIASVVNLSPLEKEKLLFFFPVKRFLKLISALSFWLIRVGQDFVW